MTRGQVIAVIIIVLLVMFVPVLFADGIVKFWDGLGVMAHRFGWI